MDNTEIRHSSVLSNALQDASSISTNDIEERYKRLVQHLDRGFCIVEVIIGPTGKPTDYIFLEVNDIFEAQTGLINPVGKTAKKLVPNLEDRWIQIYGDVALTGKSVRFTEGSEAMGRWFEVNAFKTGGKQSNQVAILFSDITDVKRAEHAEQALKESEERFRIMADAAPNIVWALNPDWSPRYVNKYAFDYLGQSQEAIEIDWASHIHPDDLQLAIEALSSAMKSRSSYQMEHRVKRYDGKYRWFLAQGAPSFYPNGELFGYVGTGIDITELKESQQNLKYSEERFEAAIEAVEGIVWTNSPEGKMEGPQPGWSELTGQRYEDYQGYGWAKAVHPDDADPTIQAWNEAVRWQRIFEFEHRVRIANGEWRRFLVKAIPLKNSDGSIREWVGVHTDVTEQRLAADAIKASESRFQNLVRDATAAIVVLSGKEMIVEIVNEAYGRLISLKPEDLLGKPLFSVIPQAEEYYLPLLEKVRQTGEPVFLFDSPYSVTTNGTRVEGFLHVVYQPYRNRAGEILGVMAILQDVTAQVKSVQKLKESEMRLRNLSERLEDEVELRTGQLKQSNEDLQQFAHVASHDLKEPVRKIKTFTSRLQEEFGDLLEGKGNLYIEKVQNATDRMASMIDGVLAYSSINATELTAETVDLNETLEDIKSDLEIVIQQKGAQIVYNNLPRVEGAGVLLYQLFYNLINNSIKFGRPDQEVIVKVDSETFIENGREATRIVVQDNGIGFDQKFSETIFNTFSRLNSKDKYEGTGLGLALCKKIVERHGGNIKASGDKGHGATFTIELPINQ